MSSRQRKQLSPRSMRERRGLLLIAELRRLNASEEEIGACQGEPETLVPLLMRTLELESAQPDAKQLIMLRRGEDIEVSTVPKIRRLLTKPSTSDDGNPTSVWSAGMKDWMSLERFRQLLGLAADAARGQSQQDEVVAEGAHDPRNYSTATNQWEDTVEEEDETSSEYDEENFGSFPVVTDEGAEPMSGSGMQHSRATKAAMAKAEVETMRAELERVEAEYAKMQAQLEQSSGGVSATALGEQSATGTEIPEEDALLEILNGVGDLRAESLRGTKTDEAEIHPEMPRMDRYSAVGEVDTEEIRAAPSPTREMTSNGNGKRKPLPMRLSQEVPLEELLQVQSEREDRQRRQVEQQPADAEREQEHSTSGQLSEEQEAEKDLSSLQLEDTNDIVKLEQLKARLAALDDAREAGALDQAAYIAARERVVAEAMAADNIAAKSTEHDTREQHHERLQDHDADKENYEKQRRHHQHQQHQQQKSKQRYKQQRFTDPGREPSSEDEAREHQRIVEQMMSGNFDGGMMHQHRKPIYSENDYEDGDEDEEYSEVDVHREAGSLLVHDENDDVYASPLRQQAATDQGDEFDPIVVSIMSEVPRYAIANLMPATSQTKRSGRTLDTDASDVPGAWCRLLGLGRQSDNNGVDSSSGDGSIQRSRHARQRPGVVGRRHPQNGALFEQFEPQRGDGPPGCSRNQRRRRRGGGPPELSAYSSGIKSTARAGMVRRQRTQIAGGRDKRDRSGHNSAAKGPTRRRASGTQTGADVRSRPRGAPRYLQSTGNNKAHGRRVGNSNAGIAHGVGTRRREFDDSCPEISEDDDDIEALLAEGERAQQMWLASRNALLSEANELREMQDQIAAMHG